MPRKLKIVDELENELKNLKSKSKDTAKKETKTKKKESKDKKKASTKLEKEQKKSASAEKDTKKKNNLLSNLTLTKKTRAKKTTKPKGKSKVTITKTTNPKPQPIVEYYDLPYRYNQTVVKVLAQTPTTLFVYWDISDDDRARFETTYGKDFFYTTKPVLIIHNKTQGYSFEIDINDFANSWYIHVVDSNCQYDIELGRRPKPNTHVPQIQHNYVYVSSSNIIASPNDHILFEKPARTLYFRNVKNNNVTTRQITDFPIIKNMQNLYNIPDLYKNLYSKLYNDQILTEYEDKDIKINNPSSGNTSSRSSFI